MTDSPTPPIPVVCDMTTATDTTEERLADYKRLFGTALVGRDHTDRGIRFRFSANAGIEELVRDLAEREHACCGFMFFEVTARDAEVCMDVWVTDDDTARVILAEYFQLPETLSEDAADLFARFANSGLDIVIEDDGVMRKATADDLGVPTRSEPESSA